MSKKTKNKQDRSLQNPFHQGEIDSQKRAGVSEELAAIANAAITNFIPEAHQNFFSKLPHDVCRC